MNRAKILYSPVWTKRPVKLFQPVWRKVVRCRLNVGSGWLLGRVRRWYVHRQVSFSMTLASKNLWLFFKWERNRILTYTSFLGRRYACNSLQRWLLGRVRRWYVQRQVSFSVTLASKNLWLFLREKSYLNRHIDCILHHIHVHTFAFIRFHPHLFNSRRGTNSTLKPELTQASFYTMKCRMFMNK